MIAKFTVYLIALTCATGAARAQSNRTANTREQSIFGLELPVKRPAAIPGAVIHILRTDPLVVSSGCANQDQVSDDTIASWFVASEVHLDGVNEPDLLIKAKNGCLFGANIGPFWIFKNSPQGYQLALTVSVLSVEVLNTRMNGYRSISASAVADGKAVTVIYEFDGSKYQSAASKHEGIK